MKLAKLRKNLYCTTPKLLTLLGLIGLSAITLNGTGPVWAKVGSCLLSLVYTFDVGREWERVDRR